jgi:hypothetical protein
MTATNKRYSYPRVMEIQIDVHPAGENLTNMPHAFYARTHMALDHTYLTRSTYRNLLWDANNVGQSNYSREIGLPTTSLARRVTDPWVPT